MADEGGDGGARVRGAVRRPAPGPRRRPRAHHLPRGHLRGARRSSTIEPSSATPGSGSRSAARSRSIGIAVAYICTCAGPGSPCGWPSATARLHAFLFNKWYFDELIDALVYRPAIAIGRFANSVFERFVVDGIVTGATGLVRGAGSVVRGAQSGFVRALRAAAGRRLRRPRHLLPGGGELMLMLNVLLWTPLAAGLLAPGGPADRRALGRGARRAGHARARDRPGRRLRPRRRRAAARRRRVLDPRPRGPLPARRRRDQRLPRPDDGGAVVRGHALVGASRRARRRPREALLLPDRARRDRGAGRLHSPRTCSCSSSSST